MSWLLFLNIREKFYKNLYFTMLVRMNQLQKHHGKQLLLFSFVWGKFNCRPVEYMRQIKMLNKWENLYLTCSVSLVRGVVWNL